MRRAIASLHCLECGSEIRLQPSRARTRRFCSTSCNYAYRAKQVEPREKTLERFWEKVDKNGPIPARHPELGACYLWTGARNEQGYGHFRLNKRVVPAHCASFQLHVGPIPDDHEVHHRCETEPCIRPDHLRDLTPLEHVRVTPGSNALKAECPSGHPYTVENTRIYLGRRYCRQCDRARRGYGVKPSHYQPVAES